MEMTTINLPLKERIKRMEAKVFIEKIETSYKLDIVDRFGPYSFHCRQFFLCRPIGPYPGSNP